MNANPQPRWLTGPVRYGTRALWLLALLGVLALIAEFATGRHSL